MNIFFFDPDPCTNAKYYPDIYNKIILEIGQMTSSVKRIECPYDIYCYKTTHKNHPMTKWVGASFIVLTEIILKTRSTIKFVVLGQIEIFLIGYELLY